MANLTLCARYRSYLLTMSFPFPSSSYSFSMFCLGLILFLLSCTL
jgi:hypothetical protein